MNGLGRRDAGAALILVLFVALLIGAVALALTFTVTLDALAARHAQEAALAEGEAEGGLQLGAYDACRAMSGGGNRLPATDGPWPGIGITAVVAVNRDTTGTVRLRAKAIAGRAQASALISIATPSSGSPVVIRSRH